MSGRTAKAAQRTKPAQPQKDRRVQAPKPRSWGRNRWWPALWVGVAIGVAVVGLYLALGRGGSGERGAGANAPGGQAGTGGAYPYATGSPGPGEVAPPVNLPSTGDASFDLASYRGKEHVLLYFQEGLMCQPCWDQLVAIERDLAKFRALGIGPIVTISGDPLDLLEQKVADEGIALPALSDPDYAVSDMYEARSYGMMGGAMNGHTFVLVDPQGNIVWRADYGGDPKYTMFVPDEVLLAELRAVLGKQA